MITKTKSWLIVAWRIAAVALVAWALGEVQQRREPPQADISIPLEKIRTVLPAASLILKPAVRNGWSDVVDDRGQTIARAVSTQPVTSQFRGYNGPTPVLILANPAGRITDVLPMFTDRTETYLDLVNEENFFDRWNSRPWQEAISSEVDTVSDATFTTRSVINNVRERLALAAEVEGDRIEVLASRSSGPARLWRDIVTMILTLAAVVLCLTGSHYHKWLRTILQVIAIIWLGFLAGTFISQDSLAGLATGRVFPWKEAPGLLLLIAATLAIPVAAGKPLYCAYLCPHGCAQELINRIGPRKTIVPKRLARALGLLPGTILMIMFILVLLGMGTGLTAYAEPFAGYRIFAHLWIPMAIAAAGLIAAIFIKRPWCRFGCATGALLRFFQRPRGEKAKPGIGDIAIAAMVVFAIIVLLTNYRLF